VVKWQLIALIPFAILLALVFSLLIARPIRQIDEAIYTMGQGELSKPVRVRGPQNLIYLGERLDWMRRRLLKLEEQKIQFLRHVSHELKTPLTSIREGVDLLAEGVAGKLTKKQQQIANILHNSSIQLQKRIEDLLSYSALQTEKSALVKHQTNLAIILDEVLQNQNLSIMSKNLKILRNCPTLLLKCDKEKIKIIMDNLISNAIKFSPQNSCIEIILTQTNGSIQLDITDAGIGIHKTDQKKIFEPFYQGKSVPDAHVKGTGLGLSIAREYALAHGGNLELIQKAGEGAHFQLTLPASELEESA
jgi:two-component system sensor histidine kinase GlrK